MTTGVPPPPRLVATDLDGTLIGRDRVITARSAAALRAAAAAGAAVVLVTGRPVRWLPRVYRQLGAGYPAVCANGAVVYEPASDTVRHVRPLGVDLLARLCTRLLAEVPGIVLAAEVDASRRLLYAPGYDPRLPEATAVAVAGPADLAAQPAVKLLVRRTGSDPDGFTAQVAAAVAGLGEVTHSSSHGLAEISAPGVTKASGLALVAAELGIAAADALAFGDMPNDVPMLTWAGTGVAVANAHPAVRRVATATTLSNVDDGVAVHLERLFGP